MTITFLNFFIKEKKTHKDIQQHMPTRLKLNRFYFWIIPT